MQHKVIYDIIHGNIELSILDAILLQDPIVNRLHQILQNSTAYTVYPNIKTTRFEHSLGTMDYAGKIFQNGLINSDYSEIYLDEKHKFIKEIVRKNHDKLFSTLPGGGDSRIRFNNILLEKFELDKSKKNFEDILNKINFIDFIYSFIGNDFIKRNIFNPLQSNEEAVKYKIVNVLLYEAARFFGMLHDIGHLPLSHLFEFSIDFVFDYLENKRKLTPIEKKYKDIISDLLRAKGNTKKDQLHEVIGKNISRFIFVGIKNNIYNDAHLKDEQKAINIFIVFVIEQIWEEIIKGEMGMLNSVYGIISNTIDADRLDFVQRDGIMSGVAKSTGNIDRILKMFCLGKRPELQPERKDQYIFMPAIQSLNDIEELLNHRFRIYKYVVNHHAVKRSDYIFQKVIEHKLIDDLKKGNVSEDLIANGLLKAIDIADEITKSEKSNIYKEISYKFIQITDFWLLSLLNKEFISSLGRGENSEFDILLKEIYENRRTIKSLWKRDHEFQDFLFEFSKKIVAEWKFSLNNEDYKIEGTNEEIDVFKEILLSLNECIQKQGKYSEVLNQIDSLNNSLKKSTLHEEKLKVKLGRNLEALKLYEDKKEKIELSITSLGIKIFRLLNILNKEFLWIKELEKSLTIEDSIILVSPPKLSTGINGLFLIDNKNQDKPLMSFEKFSYLKDSLAIEIDRSIKFYVFYLKNSLSEEEMKTKIKNKIIDFLVEKFKEIVKVKFIN